MNKVITINLGGNAYQLEEGGFDLLRNYLETAAARLQNNPDRDEILSDIESAIGEKFRALLASHKTVVVAREVTDVIAAMGPIEGDAEAGERPEPGGPGPSRAASPENTATPKRLYRIYDGAIVSGVCNGLGAYLNIDPTLVRLAFVLLTIFWGMGVLVYVIMAFVVPEARSPQEKAAASGLPGTAQEFIRRAKEGYYEAIKNFQNPRAHRRWGRWFGPGMRASAYQWRYHWGSCGMPPAPHYEPWMGFALPFLSILSGAVMITWLCALISLLATGKVLGLALPPNVPIWVAALLLCIAYGILTGSLKTARCLFWWPRGVMGRPPAPVVLAEAFIWLLVVGVLFLLASHFFPQLHTAVQAVPSILNQAKDDIHAWWNTK
jgi:phage shock protein PspC (stress-responsive transcriptional regulator)